MDRTTLLKRIHSSRVMQQEPPDGHDVDPFGDLLQNDKSNERPRAPPSRRQPMRRAHTASAGEMSALQNAAARMMGGGGGGEMKLASPRRQRTSTADGMKFDTKIRAPTTHNNSEVLDRGKDR